jgi:primosomal protein N' (replication factor Y)
MTGFPPYSRLINLVIRGKDEAMVVRASDELEQLILSLVPQIKSNEIPEVMCNTECPMEKKRCYFRHHILLRCPDASAVQNLVARSLSLYRANRGIYIEIDIDPLQML